LTGIKPVDSVQRVLGQATLTPINLLIPTIPHHVQAAIERAMSIRPEDRFGSVEDFLQALNDVTAANPTRMVSPVLPSSLDQTVSRAASTSTAVSTGAHVLPKAPGVPAGSGRGRIPIWVWGLVAVVVVFGGVILVAGAAGLIYISSTGQSSAHTATATAAALAQEAPSDTPKAARATLAPVVKPTRVLTSTSLVPSVTVAAVAEDTATEAVTTTLTPAGVDGGGVIAFASDRAGNQTDGKTLQIWTMKPYLDSSGKFIAGNFTQITSGPGDKTQPDWSPDGKKLLYVAPGGSQTQGLDIYLLDLSTPGSQPVDLSKHVGDDTDPAWSPDGKLIAFTGNVRGDGILQLFMMNADGSNLHRISTDLEEYSPTWQPDMQWLLYVINASGNKYLYRRYMDTGYSYMTSTPSGYDSAEIFGRFGQVEQPKISPDGATLAYVQIKGPSLFIFTADYNKRGAQFAKVTTTGKDQNPAWSADSQMIVFTSERDGNSEIYIMTAGGLLQTNLTNNPGRDLQPAWQP
jgi:TolB protein